MVPNHCRCCGAHSCAGCADGPSRREFAATAVAGALAPMAAWAASAKDPERRPPIDRPLRVQPVLSYETPARRDQTSWRQWGAIQTEADAQDERKRIESELAKLRTTTGRPVEFAPFAAVRTVEEAQRLAQSAQADSMLIYGAGGSVRILEALTDPKRFNLLFLRHRSGPVSLWYEIADPRMLRKTRDERAQQGMGVEDVVVDSLDDLAVRLRAQQALKNTIGKRMVAIGGASGWGEGGRTAPANAQTQFQFDIRNVGYDELGARLNRARQDANLTRRAADACEKYLKRPGLQLETAKPFVERAFLLTEVFRDLLDEADTDAMTINQCMGTVMKVSETTACLPLSILNDEGYMAFCESDFVVIPSGVLLRYISGNPVFLNDPTHPHHGLVTLAHCTAPRRNDGAHDDPVRVMTHFESDYGAAPKVEMRKGQRITVLDPDFASKRWLGFEGEIVDNPFMPICRSQIDVQIKGDCDRLVEEMRGFHWMACYGNHLQETAYALKKLGIGWLRV